MQLISKFINPFSAHFTLVPLLSKQIQHHRRQSRQPTHASLTKTTTARTLTTRPSHFDSKATLLTATAILPPALGLRFSWLPCTNTTISPAAVGFATFSRTQHNTASRYSHLIVCTENKSKNTDSETSINPTHPLQTHPVAIRKKRSLLDTSSTSSSLVGSTPPIISTTHFSPPSSPPPYHTGRRSSMVGKVKTK